MIAKVELSYDAKMKLEKMAAECSDEDFALLKRVLSQPEDKTREDLKSAWAWAGGEIYLDEEEQAILLSFGLTYEVKRIKGTMFREMRLPEPEGRTVNTYVQVPHVGLLAIREVMLEENCCTDLLQKRLDEGWTLLCVCPPNAARRPDYILGRTKESR